MNDACILAVEAERYMKRAIKLCQKDRNKVSLHLTKKLYTIYYNIYTFSKLLLQ